MVMRKIPNVRGVQTRQQDRNACAYVRTLASEKERWTRRRFILWGGSSLSRPYHLIMHRMQRFSSSYPFQRGFIPYITICATSSRGGHDKRCGGTVAPCQFHVFRQVGSKVALRCLCSSPVGTWKRVICIPRDPYRATHPLPCSNEYIEVGKYLLTFDVTDRQGWGCQTQLNFLQCG